MRDKVMRKYLLVPLAVSLLSLTNAYGQKKVEGQLPPHAGSARGGLGVCAEQTGRTGVAQGGTHTFRQMGVTVEIPLSGGGVPAGVSDCDPVGVELQWA